jgi:hypothetical protein
MPWSRARRGIGGIRSLARCPPQRHLPLCPPAPVRFAEAATEHLLVVFARTDRARTSARRCESQGAQVRARTGACLGGSGGNVFANAHVHHELATSTVPAPTHRMVKKKEREKPSLRHLALFYPASLSMGIQLDPWESVCSGPCRKACFNSRRRSPVRRYHVQSARERLLQGHAARRASTAGAAGLSMDFLLDPWESDCSRTCW